MDLHGRQLTPPATRRPLLVAAAAVLLVVTGVVLVHAAGLRGFVVSSASMGTAAPVGTLVVTRPVALDDLRVGDVVTFRPPSSSGHDPLASAGVVAVADGAGTVTHRVDAVTAEGVRTRGDASGAADPWLLHDEHLVGRAAAVVPVAGWVVRAVPLLVAGAAVVWLLTLLVPRAPLRSSLRVLGGTVVVCAVLALLRPLTAATVLATRASDGADGGPGGVATVAGTGVLPVHLSTALGSETVLASGELGELALPVGRPDGGGALITIAPHLGAVGWVVLLLVSALPLLWCLAVGLRPVPTPGRRQVAAS